MTDVQSSDQPLLPGRETAESTGKQYLKQAWAYSQRIELASRDTRHTLDLYSSKLQDLRRKLREKCVEILLLSCSQRRKAEELLWKRTFYDLVQRSKSNKQTLDGGSPLYLVYSEHLSAATAFYAQLICRLEEHYHIPVTSMDATKLWALDDRNADAQWLRGAVYRCTLYLGDLARYRVDIGGKPYTAVTHYLHAISLDTTNGAPFNQLAALSGSEHEGLDAVYYYMRSVSSAKPFQGTEVNLQRIFRKTADRLESLRGNKERATETNIREATCSLLLVRLVTLQHMLSSAADKTAHSDEKSLSDLCDVLLSDLEECLTFDLQLFIDMTQECVQNVIHVSSGDNERGTEGDGERSDFKRVEELYCLPSGLLLKIVALCMLSSTILRKQGSARTPVISSFTVSVFSLLLHYSFLRLSHLTRHTVHTLTRGTLGTKHTSSAAGREVDGFDPTNEGSMVRIFLKHLKGEMLDEYAQQTPGIARQLRVNSAPTTTLRAVEESVGRLSIGPSITWGGWGAVCDEGGVALRNGERGDGGKQCSGDVRREEGGRNGLEGKDMSDKEQGRMQNQKSAQKEVNKKAKKKKVKVVDRRRQRRRVATPPTSEEEDEDSELSGSSPGSESSVSSSAGEEEEYMDMIDSLSETSLSGGEEGGEGGVGSGVSTSEEGTNEQWISKSTDAEVGKEEKGGGRGGGGGEEGIGEGGGKRGGGGGRKRQIVLAANFSGQATIPVSSERCGVEEVNTAGDDQLFQTLLLQTRHQAALHLACSLVAEETYLMSLKIFSDWLTEHPPVITLCAQSSQSLWSRLASLLNFLPPAKEIVAAGLRTTLPPGMEWSQTHALREDTLLRGFTPLTETHQKLVFETTTHPELLEKACNRICVLHKFGRYIAKSKAVAEFQWDGNEERFLAPLQREREEERAADVTQRQQEEKAAENRSKLMKAMAQRRLQSEVASLAEMSAQQEASVFTPYLLPDALTLCTGLHLIRKLLASEKFIVIIAKSVIDDLDGMKKGRQNYAAREAIKFLERSLQGGGRMVRVQGDEETMHPGRKKPSKQDLNTWRYSGLVDCALYFTHTFAERSSSYRASTTLLLDRSVVKQVEGGGSGKEKDAPLISVLSEAELYGVPIDTVVRFHGKWQSSQRSSQPPRHHTTTSKK